jgi:hypothetical protein
MPEANIARRETEELILIASAPSLFGKDEMGWRESPRARWLARAAAAATLFRYRRLYLSSTHYRDSIAQYS